MLQYCNCGRTRAEIRGHASQGVYKAHLLPALMVMVTSFQVKECYLVHLLQRFHNEEDKSIVIFTPTCRYV